MMGRPGIVLLVALVAATEGSVIRGLAGNALATKIVINLNTVLNNSNSSQAAPSVEPIVLSEIFREPPPSASTLPHEKWSGCCFSLVQSTTSASQANLVTTPDVPESNCTANHSALTQVEASPRVSVSFLFSHE
jgi:hypothetical protein